MVKKLDKLKKNMYISFAFGATFAYFIWLTWAKLTEFIGDSTMVWYVTGSVVLIGLLLGKFTIKKIAENFT